MPFPGSFPLSFSVARESDRTASNGPLEVGGSLSDAQIIALARESHAEAFELLYATFKGRLYTFLLRIVGDPESADDLTHDVFAKALKLLPTLTSEHKVLPWLYRVANNAAIDQLRRRHRFSWLRIGALHGTHEEPRAADDHSRIPEQAHVQQVLRMLPPENAAALLLHAIEGYSYKEIADIQGVSLTAVRSRIARARATFKERYQPTAT
jgi:RNA polymerase sigma-70 factor (ECF subfamily)